MSITKGTILLADDEETFVDSLADLLRTEGYECVTVRDGLSAAAELNTHPNYDLLIADIRMPGNPQLELIRHLPQIADGLPVILVTAYPDAQSQIRSSQLPVLSYLVKPIKMEELLPLVERGVGHSALHRANQSIARRIRAWDEDVKMVSQLLDRGAPGAGVSPDVFLGLCLRNVLACLSDLDALCQKLPKSNLSGSNPSGSNLSCEEVTKAISAALRAFEVSAAANQK